MMAQNEQTTEERSTLEQQSPGRRIERNYKLAIISFVCSHIMLIIHYKTSLTYKRFGRFCFVYINACIAVIFFCCYRFSVNKDLYISLVGQNYWRDLSLAACLSLAGDNA